MGIPLDVEDRRQRALLLRHVADEPLGLVAGGAAPVEEMIGAARHAGAAGLDPVAPEGVVDMVDALGRLDPGEIGALAAQRIPVDAALPARHVDAVNGKVLRLDAAEADRLGLAEILFVDPRTNGAHRVGRRGEGHLLVGHDVRREQRGARRRDRRITGQRGDIPGAADIGRRHRRRRYRADHLAGRLDVERVQSGRRRTTADGHREDGWNEKTHDHPLRDTDWDPAPNATPNPSVNEK